MGTRRATIERADIKYPNVLIISSVLMAAAAQLLLKHGMMTPALQYAMLGDVLLNKVGTIIGSGAIWLGVGFCFLSMVAWRNVLAKIEVTTAYPFVGLGFVATTLLGFLVLG